MGHLSYTVNLKYGSDPTLRTGIALETITTGETDYKYRWLRFDRVISKENPVVLQFNGSDIQIIFIDYLLGLILTHDHGVGDYTLNFHEIILTSFAEINDHYIELTGDEIDVTTYNTAKINGRKQYYVGHQLLKIGIGSLDIIEQPPYGVPIVFEYSNDYVIKRGFVTFVGVETSGSIYSLEQQKYVAYQSADKQSWGVYYGEQSLPGIPSRLSWETLPLTWDYWIKWSGGVA